jgi:SAM-dependent methyltransferase
VIGGEVSQSKRAVASDYDPALFIQLHAAEASHFWHVARRRFIRDQMVNHIDPAATIIEIGAGTGYVASDLVASGYCTYLFGDRVPEALLYERTHLPAVPAVQFDLRQAPFRNSFDVALMFDVLEHLDNDIDSLRQVRSILRDGGRLVMTVPAHQWLWHADDVASGHKRRYSRRTLTSTLDAAGFDVSTSRYFFIALVPLLLVRRILNPDRGASGGELSDRFFKIGRVSNWVLGTLCRAEQAVFRFIPNVVGGSLFVIARSRSSKASTRHLDRT